VCGSDDASVKNRLTECLETILNKAQEPPKSKKVQHSNAKNAVLFEAINLIIHMDSDPNLLVRGCNQLGQFLQHRETNLRLVMLQYTRLLVLLLFYLQLLPLYFFTQPPMRWMRICFTDVFFFGFVFSFFFCPPQKYHTTVLKNG